MKIRTYLKCNRCGFQSDEILDISDIYLPDIGHFVLHPTAVHMTAWPIHRCDAIRVGTMTPLGFDVLPEEVTGREPELGNKNDR